MKDKEIYSFHTLNIHVPWQYSNKSMKITLIQLSDHA